MTPEQIREARALCEAASRGGWRAHPEWASPYGVPIYCATPNLRDERDHIGNAYLAEDAAFIAAARTLLPLALDAIEERDAEIERLRVGLRKIARAAGSPYEPVSDRDAQLRRVVVGALARIAAYGNPLANLTDKEIADAVASDDPEILGAWPDPGEQVVS